MQIELNENEAQVLTGLIDIAIKSGGLQVAEAGVALATKIAKAAKAAQGPQVEQVAEVPQAVKE